MGTSRWLIRPPARTFVSGFRSRVRTVTRLSASAIVAVAAATASGCRGTEAVTAAPVATVEREARSDALLDIIRYGNNVRSLNRDALMEQYRDLAFGGPYLANNAQIRLALLLSAPHALHDVARARSILDDVSAASGLPEHVEFASLISALLDERIAAMSENEVLFTLLTEARDRNEQLQQELAAAGTALEEAQARADTLQGQLDALKRLEEQISNDSIERP